MWGNIGAMLRENIPIWWEMPVFKGELAVAGRVFLLTTM